LCFKYRRFPSFYNFPKWYEIYYFNLSLILFVENDPCEDETLLSYPFHLLVGSDGASSVVRKSANIPYLNQETFHVHGVNHTLPGIKQVTMIANFDVKEGKCPDLEVDKFGEVLSPWEPAFLVPGIII
jgi:hypothetical protein